MTVNPRDTMDRLIDINPIEQIDKNQRPQLVIWKSFCNEYNLGRTFFV